MISRTTYEKKPAGLLGAAAPVMSQVTCNPIRSFRNDHVIGWPMGTGGGSPD